ncbi:type II secretion system protein [uncultured Candidatus Pelagibacter sp.]|jgi:prepilin-type N-terminal cleavage/methylation domain-containing protein|uniref:type IV pilin protein n=1 Tax=uncultured Candidatus Pelagibacter sp. TaxID=372654 RepID=UPI0023243E2F|nr:type II secretion system protein [uncultured Candidatus Pelagibacter sp.]MDA8532693.1 type II secretion system GspH family protein [Candidatus Pelagibacter bacterium]|tara:strand:+ start:105 stop:530 length:426 start_codon:yes stop_codon:yes gene_type:complete
MCIKLIKTQILFSNKKNSKGFTLIELLVVVAIIGILSAVGVVSYSGYKTSAEKKQAEITLNSIYLAEQEYKSNNGEYYISTSQSNIVTNLFDGVDDLDGQAYTFKTTAADTLTIIATKISDTSCTIKITQTKKKPVASSSC